MQKLKYLLKETLNNLWQFRVRNIFSTTIICLSFLTIGTFLALSNNLHYTAKQLSKEMVIVFFLEKNLPEKQRSLIEERLKKSVLLKNVQFVSSEQALNKFRNNFPELVQIIENLNINPFPASLETSLKEETLSPTKTEELIEEMRSVKGIDDIQYNRDWVDKMQSFSRLAKAVGFFLGGILILASFFIISNVIRLNVFARKTEIEILRLAGATNTFIRVPFLIEGVILGIIGGLLSLFLLFLLVKLFPLYLGTSLGVLSEIINFRYLTLSQTIMLIAGSIIVGLLGSFSSLSRFLKV
jgi:cell division transport system permease protein